MADNDALIALPEVRRLTSLSKPVIYKLVREGTFPRQVRVTTNRVAWRRSAIVEWIAKLPNVEASKAA